MAKRYIDADEFLEGFYIYAYNQDKAFVRAVEQVIADTPTADVVEVKRIEIIRDDLKWWLETNTEKGVVHIPEYVVKNMIAKMDGGKEE